MHILRLTAIARSTSFAVLALTACAPTAAAVAEPREPASPVAASPPELASPGTSSREKRPGERFRTDLAWGNEEAWLSLVRVTRSLPLRSAPSRALAVQSTLTAAMGTTTLLEWLYVTTRAGRARVLVPVRLGVRTYGPVAELRNGGNGRTNEPPLVDGMTRVNLELAAGQELELLSGDGHFIGVGDEVYWVESCGGAIQETCDWEASAPPEATASPPRFRLLAPAVVERWVHLQNVRGDAAVAGWAPFDSTTLRNAAPLPG